MPAGRQREFTPEKQTEFCGLVAKGLTVAEAARQIGVSLRTVQREVRCDEDFEHDLCLAQEVAPVNPLKLMQQAAKTHWRAAAWMLERTDPERFGKRRPRSCGLEQLQAALAAMVEAAVKASEPSQQAAIGRAVLCVAESTLHKLFPQPQDGASAAPAVAATPPAPSVSRGPGQNAVPTSPTVAAARTQSSPSAAADEFEEILSRVFQSPVPAHGILSPKMHMTTEILPRRQPEPARNDRPRRIA